MNYNMPPNDPNADRIPEQIKDVFAGIHEATSRQHRPDALDGNGYVSLRMSSEGTPLEPTIGTNGSVVLIVRVGSHSSRRGPDTKTATMEWGTLQGKYYRYALLNIQHVPTDDDSDLYTMTAWRGGYEPTGSSLPPLDDPRQITGSAKLSRLMNSAQAGLEALRQLEEPESGQH